MPKLLPALERNILKYRSFQMLLIAFHIENLRRFVISSIQFTDKIHNNNSLERSKGKNILEKAWEVLIEDGILTEQEVVELTKIVKIRDTIAHTLHKLTGDIGDSPKKYNYSSTVDFSYDYHALKKLRAYQAKIQIGMLKKYAVMASFDSLIFEDTETTFEHELKILGKKIQKQMAIRKERLGL